ncbi:MAG: hypothetical protein AAB358_02560 [Patescibacteria group bacterium]
MNFNSQPAISAGWFFDLSIDVIPREPRKCGATVGIPRNKEENF